MNLLLFLSMAQAFCGFYVGGAGTELFNNATMVVMMREGTRTVLSMQNNYEGPPEDFAMVVPVPVVLEEEEVRTLDSAIFDKVDAMAAPRLVEYWERDPCKPPIRNDLEMMAVPKRSVRSAKRVPQEQDVVVEAEFTVAEYDIVILSAKEAGALDKWLRGNSYSIPEGAEPLFKPYIAAGQYFFVAKVDASKVSKKEGRTTLSPLRFHYDSETFQLPVRLGLINAKETQDLVVHILAKDRYEAANMENTTIPTNIELSKEAKDVFPSFYAELFDATLARSGGAVVTEYAWDAATCDPCPGPNLTRSDLQTLGADVLASRPRMVLTRLHSRYTRQSLGDDLVFRQAEPIQGGREVKLVEGSPLLERGATAGRVNNFQGRYIIRHPWEGPVACENPLRGVWEGPPGGAGPSTATGTAFVKRGKIQLAGLVSQDIPEIGIEAGKLEPEVTDEVTEEQDPPEARCEAASATGGMGAALAGLLALFRRQRE
jgi:hypothetical protein